MMFLDDLNPDQLTEEQKQEFQRMYEEDPYHFYNLWRDPDAIQRYFEGDDTQTTPATEVYVKLGALKMAHAPQNVLDFWSDVLKNRGRPTEDTSAYPPKTKPIADKIEQIDTLCKHINESLNYSVDNVTPVEDDFPDEIPIAAKWQQIMHRAMGAPKVEEHNLGAARHYKSTDVMQASMGVEILEVIITGGSAEINLEDCFDLDLLSDEEYGECIHPNSVSIKRTGEYTLLRFEYFDCYE